MNKKKSRDLKRIRSQPVSPAVRSAIETELWFRLNQPSRGKRVDTQDIFEEMLHWFLDQSENTPPSYEKIDGHWPRLKFWLDVTTLTRCAALTKRDNVTLRRVIGTAFTAYCAKFVSSALQSFREETARRGTAIYVKHRKSAAQRKTPKQKTPRP